MDRFNSVILFAGLGCFVLAGALSGLYPYLITDANVPEASIEDVAQNVPGEFRDLKDRYPVAFGAAFPRADEALTVQERMGLDDDDPRLATSEDAWREAYAVALRSGRDTYVSEVCFHCHSQFVRPVANEAQRFGPVLLPDHDNNALQRPVLWGTRRVGPDLTHEGGLRSNDWHMAHLWDPASTSPGSVMPRYSWLFREGYQIRRTIDPDKADRGGLPEDRSYPVPGVHDSREAAEAAMVALRGSLPQALASEGERLFVEEARGPDERALALVAYLQWLGTWTPPHLMAQEDAR
jgi:cbb3-type cytochrome c oxidase subunit II